MKLKLMLLTIVLALFTGCYEPAKEKVEIRNQKPLVWITPTESYCDINNGRMGGYTGNTCISVWSSANNMCRLRHGRLPTVKELSKVVTDCGGRMHNNDAQERTMNDENVFYQNCYDAKGFTPDLYWTSNTYEELGEDFMAYVSFAYGTSFGDEKDKMRAVRCVKVD